MRNTEKITAKNTKRISLIMGLIALLSFSAGPAAVSAPGQKASDPPFKVKIDFNRWRDVDELYSDMRRLQAAWPKLLTLKSIGKSYQGRDILLMVVNNPDTGPEMSKAAMYIDANIHGNEIQGAEVCLYTIWYMMENYGRIPDLTRIVDERVFYIAPTVNPDGRQYFMEKATRSARSGMAPYDLDGDGLFDEDGPNDLNGNGYIEQMRKYVPGRGTHRISPANPNMIEPVPPGETGDYIYLGWEGLDDDGDGFIAEDGPGGYDANRNWGSDWQPEYIQRGALDYPFQLPETRAVNDFLMAHPNIAGVQAYHNMGGMILRGPGSEAAGEYPFGDVQAYDELARTGERMLPFYRYLVIWSGLYTVHGGFIDWTNDGLGILSFSNELWSSEQYFTSQALKDQQKDPQSPIAPPVARDFFDRHLEFGDQYLDWKPFDHPQYGRIEIGGAWKKYHGRIPPRFMSEEMCHRNAAFTIYQADQMPLIRIGETSVEKAGDGVFRVFIDVSNPKITPTILEKAAQNNVVRPDLMLLEGKNLEVIAAGFIDNRELYKVRPSPVDLIDQNDLKRIVVRSGHPARTTRTVMYVVKGSGNVTFTYDSVKGGKDSATIFLK